MIINANKSVHYEWEPCGGLCEVFLGDVTCLHFCLILGNRSIPTRKYYQNINYTSLAKEAHSY